MTSEWIEKNQRYLSAELARIKSYLELFIEHSGSECRPPAGESAAAGHAGESTIGEPPAIEAVSTVFGLSAFERMLLLLCAAVELDGSFGSLCARAHHDPVRSFPTFSLALAAFPNAHWSALSPARPLRYWKLIDVGRGSSLTTSPLRIDEPILHCLAGLSYRDERLSGLTEPPEQMHSLVPSHARVAASIGQLLRNSSVRALPVIQLCGSESSDKRDIARAACADTGLQLSVISAGSISVNPGEAGDFTRIWEREAALNRAALLLDFDTPGIQESAVSSAMTVAQRVQGPLMISSRDPICGTARPAVTFNIRKPLPEEQRSLWQETLDGRVSGEQIEGMVSQFDLGSSAIRDVAEQTFATATASEDLQPVLWETCRVITRPRIETLAQRIEPSAAWDDLVLPVQQKEILQEISLHVRRRAQVYGEWGFGSSLSRGLGISALFEGASGTGKTMAAEVLAGDLRLDLYRIDLSQVVSKYIGETEKNLRRVFDAAESGGAILLFDEADALFGKRSEVKDSHDRYANIEVSYLLQRMEAYRGPAILTTNMKSALDPAFLRRIRFVVQFPFPDVASRAEIWKRVFPRQTPTAGLDVDKLARLSVPGGNIRNIALNAAFLAAGDGGEVRMSHVLRAAGREYAKIEKPLSAIETAGWI